MTSPAPWLDPAAALDHVGVKADDPNADAVERARAAAAAYVQRARPDLYVTAADGTRVFTPDADVVEGALLLTARLHARKGSPSGVASYGEFGPANLPRLDPDVERLLGLGRHAPPMVG